MKGTGRIKGIERLSTAIEVASGKRKADLLIKNCRLINVFSHRIEETDVAVFQGRFIGFGPYRASRVLDLEGGYLSPGFIDGHCHIESSMLSPQEFARAVVPRGTTTVVADPHEIANVMGSAGIAYLAEAAEVAPLNLYMMVPSCVPATHMETSGARITAKEVEQLLDQPWAIGLGEMMNFPGVIEGAEELLEKIERASSRPVDGHAPSLSGMRLNAYILPGIRSDHESVSAWEAMEKLRRGMTIMIREGSTAKNLEALLPIVTHETSRRCLMVTDDRHPKDLLEEGHLDHLLRKAISLGLDPVTAIQMVTLNTAQHFGLREIGAVAPGLRADAVILGSLDPLTVEGVIKDGILVWKKGRWTRKAMEGRRPLPESSMKTRGLQERSFKIEFKGSRAHVIELVPGQIITGHLIEPIREEGGIAVSDPQRDILKIAVIERHRFTGNVGLGFVKGFGMARGAIASSVAHDSHNIIVVGVSDHEMFRAADAIRRMGGGQVVVEGRRVTASVPLPIAGLMSQLGLKRLKRQLDRLHAAAASIGCDIDDPFTSLSFLALPVIPSLKITDKGLVDVERFELISLFE